MNTNQTNTQAESAASKAVYTKPVLKNAGSLADLTQGFSGSLPDEQGGHTKRNPFQG
ncbi:MAG: lasso RiPP family leader peptide-containing protein [Colwellia sp.]|nr:lasso RiPP family leader peptide-containing protein [Colwellia sp.]